MKFQGPSPRWAEPSRSLPGGWGGWGTTYEPSPLQRPDAGIAHQQPKYIPIPCTRLGDTRTTLQAGQRLPHDGRAMGLGRQSVLSPPSPPQSHNPAAHGRQGPTPKKTSASEVFSSGRTAPGGRAPRPPTAFCGRRGRATSGSTVQTKPPGPSAAPRPSSDVKSEKITVY